MENKRGFTLIEIVVVVGLLALIGVAIAFSANSLLKNQKEDEYENFIKRIESAANTYVTSNSEILEDLYTDKGYVIITIGDLIGEGLINQNTINPETNEPIDFDDIIKVSLTSTGAIDIEYPVAEIKEDYLQAMDFIIEIGTNIDTICYQGINDNGLRYIDNNGNFVKNYLKQEENIKCNKDNVNINKLGTYTINYDYKITNPEEKWKQQSRNVTVADTTAPEILSLTFDSSNKELVSKSIDRGSGISYYYFGSENNLINISEKGFKITETTDEVTKKTPITTSGTYYFYAQDAAGNITSKPVTINISTSTTTRPISSGPEPDLTCPEISINYLNPTGNSKEKDGLTYYEYKVMTKNETLACRYGPAFWWRYNTNYMYLPGSKVYYRKVSGQGSKSIQWYQSWDGCYSAATYCKPTITKTIKTGAFAENDLCWTNTAAPSPADARSDVDLRKYKGWSVKAIDLEDGWFYVQETGNSGYACFIWHTTFSN